MSTDRAPLLTFDAVSLGYGGIPVLEDLSFEIAEGDFMGIVGPNGGGKTTILRGMLGLLMPLSGSIRMHGHDSDDVFHFGYVPQRETVDDRYPFTVEDVVLMGRYRRIGLIRRPTQVDRDEIARALQFVGMESRGRRLFRELSGGQRQRTLLARALTGEPDLLILDEPVSGLDLAGNAAIMGLVHRLHADRGLTIVMVSHELNTVVNWVSHVGLLHDGHLRVGTCNDVLTSEALSSIYGTGARVAQVNGRRVVLPPTGDA